MWPVVVVVANGCPRLRILKNENGVRRAQGQAIKVVVVGRGVA
jgi:hypothetical protein